MEKYFVLLGENPLLWGQVCHLRELGYKVILVAWSEKPRIQGDMYIQKDIKDAPAIIAELESLGLSGLGLKVEFAVSSLYTTERGMAA